MKDIEKEKAMNRVDNEKVPNEVNEPHRVDCHYYSVRYNSRSYCHYYDVWLGAAKNGRVYRCEDCKEEFDK